MRILNPSDLALLLKHARKDKKLTQAECAFAALLSQPTVSGFEKNPSNARVETLFALLNTLELDIEIVPRSSVKKGGDEW
jgi:HTH-type transcriptional regulator/antitoxin HipB